ncbi:unnamed protein product [Vitrella brassicaformis CCMP3155]|uniref:Uncharacterized protein n=1 Tax=Vitrella brassicaformis (strain CCMP3155) TaxID=1169540 RepID=A0A0G4G8D4_VITBC|nr:unnamed protein product [Vitrella brassicaformis CCMP3155]|mmetsp:Transcript_16708/g.47578  ORF Transcript_16708/g.47578 Transcript_16708/m.47578 type:complete len:130 (+) Transcript_16708:187-576(+)|eukprot:CEM24788.1 unnamed protein product [Vitrella brassicaformis CCMP3155]
MLRYAGRCCDAVIDAHNKLADTSFPWFPFLCFRPSSPAEPIKLITTVLMAPCFALLFNALMTLYSVFLYRHPFSLESTAIAYLYWCLGFLVWFNICTRPLWNIRAYRLLRGDSGGELLEEQQQVDDERA